MVQKGSKCSKMLKNDPKLEFPIVVTPGTPIEPPLACIIVGLTCIYDLKLLHRSLNVPFEI